MANLPILAQCTPLHSICLHIKAAVEEYLKNMVEGISHLPPFLFSLFPPVNRAE